MARLKFTVEQVIDALEKHKGMVYLAADYLQCTAKTIYNYAKTYPTIQHAIDTQRGKVTDVAELALYRAIQNGEAWAICFYLKTQGRSRGYVERQQVEHSGPDGGKLQLDVIISSALEKAYDDGDNGNGSTE